MLEDLFGIDPIPAIKANSFPNEILGIFTNLFPLLAFHLIIAQNDFLQNFVIIIPIKWWISTEHDIENNSCGPNITFGVIGAHQDFWGHVVRGAYYLVGFFFAVDLKTRTEIDQFYVEFGIVGFDLLFQK